MLTGSNTLRIRVELGMSENTFAAFLGVAPYVVRQWEREGSRFKLTPASVCALEQALRNEGKGN